ncbi:MAG: hypothetical protein P8Y47_11560, partial [Alphaproteobacteria bacterium]
MDNGGKNNIAEQIEAVRTEVEAKLTENARHLALLQLDALASIPNLTPEVAGAVLDPIRNQLGAEEKGEQAASDAPADEAAPAVAE